MHGRLCGADCDNKTAINIAHNPLQHYSTKHIEVNRYFIKQMLEIGIMCIPFVPAYRQLAGISHEGTS